jgi:hypothetical protein
VPLLDACPTRVVLEIGSRLDDGSDHACFVGAPILAEWAPSTPLRVSRTGQTEAGHEATERATPGNLAAAGEPGAHPDPMGPSTRHDMESAAAGAGHAVDLSVEEDDGTDR